MTDVIQPEDRHFRLLALIAAGLWGLCAVAQLWVLVSLLGSLPKLHAMFEGVAAVPLPTAALFALGWWSVPIALVVDVAIFWLFYRLARRHWTGWLFAPAAFFALLGVGGLLMIVLGLGFQVTTVVK